MQKEAFSEDAPISCSRRKAYTPKRFLTLALESIPPAGTALTTGQWPGKPTFSPWHFDSLSLILTSLTLLLPACCVLPCRGLSVPTCCAHQVHSVELDGVFLGVPFCCHCNGQDFTGDSEELALGCFQLSVVQVYFKASWGIRVEILGNRRGAGTKEQQTTLQ